MSGPYIITTKRPHGGGVVPFIRSLRAVATLEEARAAVTKIIRASIAPSGGRATVIAQASGKVTESGGTVGPLPDGTVIEVAEVDYVQLRAAIEMPFGDESEQQIIDAYNAKQARP